MPLSPTRITIPSPQSSPVTCIRRPRPSPSLVSPKRASSCPKMESASPPKKWDPRAIFIPSLARLTCSLDIFWKPLTPTFAGQSYRVSKNPMRASPRTPKKLFLIKLPKRRPITRPLILKYRPLPQRSLYPRKVAKPNPTTGNTHVEPHRPRI